MKLSISAIPFAGKRINTNLHVFSKPTSQTNIYITIRILNDTLKFNNHDIENINAILIFFGEAYAYIYDTLNGSGEAYAYIYDTLNGSGEAYASSNNLPIYSG